MVRVVPDVSGLNKEFDYRVPDGWEVPPVGALVRVDLHGRRVAGWVVATAVEPPAGVELRPLIRVSSLGPSAEVIGLARWAAHRWHGRLATLLKTASPDTMVPVGRRSAVGRRRSVETDTDPELAAALARAFANSGVTVLRVAPGHDRFPILVAAGERGNAIVLAPDVAEARHLGGRYRRAGGLVALAGRDFERALAGGVVTGARRAAWATLDDIEAVVVFDEHAESYQEERNPTWHARDVAIERARRLGCPCVLVSPVPSLAALAAADQVVTLGRSHERAGWPVVEVIDRRRDDERGLFSSRLATIVRGPGRVLGIVNRKGRAHLLVCGSCDEVVTTLDGVHLMTEIEGELVAAATGERRPKVCSVCAGTKLKRLRLGVSRVREELAALAGEPVAEITGDASAEDLVSALREHRILVGTEALLHRVPEADVVCFLDFDQELLATRYRAGEQAMALLARAARLVGPRNRGRVAVQTRLPEHRVLTAAVAADPGRFAEAELELRRAAGMPPTSALAEVSGAQAREWLEPLFEPTPPTLPPGVVVMGPREDGRYLVRAGDADQLADVLAELGPAKGRVRVAVDPPRV